VAIVTGASAGIGAEIVQSLVCAGLEVVGLARRVEKIREIAAKLEGQKGRLYAFECDVSKEDDILKAFQWAENNLGGVDILINNAGVLVIEPIIDGTTETFRNILDVNVLAFAICAREAVKSMRKRGKAGHIVVINSLFGHNAEIAAYPVSLYSASKYAVTAMVASLQSELAAAKLNIKVTSVSPGVVDTDMAERVGYSRAILESPISMKAKDVSDAVIYALGTPLNVQVRELTIAPMGKIIAPMN